MGKLDLSKYKDADLSRLTEKQKEVFFMALQGISGIEIAQKRGCSKQNVYASISVAKNKLDSPAPSESLVLRKRQVKRQEKFDPNQYKDKDLSILTPKEKEVMILWIAGNSYDQIATALGISRNAVGTLLFRARKKLDGDYDEERERIREYAARRRAILGKEKVRELNRKYIQNAAEKGKVRCRTDDNKKYYQEHREEILARQKERRRKSEKG